MLEPRYNEAVEDFRDQEYPMLKDSVYLDHAGATLCPSSLMQGFAAEMTSCLYGNPHSASSSSQLSTARIEDTRLRLLRFFKADPAEYDLVFVANATAGAKLVLEGMRSLPRGYSFAYHEACHTSLIGLRCGARKSACLDDDAVQSWLHGKSAFTPSTASGPSGPSGPSATLFAYSAQSHMDGRRYPLSWSGDIKNQACDVSGPIFTLLDVASLAATSQLDLSHPRFAADFVVLSLYKIFGFPDLGVLIARRSAASIWDDRGYFGGGTVEMVACGKSPWYYLKHRSLHERLEDGTLPFHNIMAADVALETHTRLFGSMDSISAHTAYLCRELCHGLGQLRHGNGKPVCVMYTEWREGQTGPLVSFNIKDCRGAWIRLTEVEKLAVLKGVHIRTGGLCSPAAIASALDLQPWEMIDNLSAGFRCGEDTETSSLKPTGVIRASLGAMSTKSDVLLFLDFIKEFFVEQDVQAQPEPGLTTADGLPRPGLRVKGITVFPIKSCGGFQVPPDVDWQVRAEGLAWDREWCLIHQGSGQALSQKRHPRMALLQPCLMFERDVLRVRFLGNAAENAVMTRHVDIPLSTTPSLFDADFRSTPSRVCGESIDAQAYLSHDINRFFSDALGVPCVLARFPPGGCGASSRSSKARMQRHQNPVPSSPSRGLSGGMLSPPDSDWEQQQQQQQPGKILLSNESPILLVHTTSIAALNQEIEDRGGVAVAESAFRANIIVESDAGERTSPYVEDFWSSLRIGSQSFTLLGACQRCQMVCVDQDTGERGQEPLSTLAKTRRLNGRVFFGVHMRLETLALPATIRVGDAVVVDGQSRATG